MPELLEYGLSEIQMLDQSSGQIATWNWTYTPENGAVQSSSLQNPIFMIPANASGNQIFQLVVATAQGCTNEVTSVLNVIEDAAIYIPNSFSPDGDGFNNSFQVSGKNIASEFFELSIYNRWGELIFSSQDPTIGWDGAVADRGIAPTGVYTYQVTYRFTNQEKSQTITGNLNLLK